MRYRINCYTEWEHYYVYCEAEDTANMLFGVLADSKEFSYVTLEEEAVRFKLVKECANDQA